jgi:hypothetical protein
VIELAEQWAHAQIEGRHAEFVDETTI